MNTLDSLFTWFVSATIRASLLALAVIALQAALRKHLSARWRYALWLPVVLVLAAPSLPQSRWSVENYVQPNVVVIAPPTSTTGVALAVVAENATPGPVVKRRVDWRRAASVGWFCGVVVFVVFGIVAYARSLRRMRRAEVPASVALRQWIAEAAAECGFRDVPRVLVSEAVTSPAVTGCFRPRLLLPAELEREYTRGEVRLILLHELTHLRRHDVPWNWLLWVLQALHWCNPVLWLAFARLRTNREEACDEQVLATTPGDERAEYGHVLLKLAGTPRTRGFNLGFVGIFGPASATRTRLLGIANYRRKHAAWKVVGFALVVALGVAGATRAEQAAAIAVQGGKLPRVLLESEFIAVTKKTVPLELEGERIGAEPNGSWAIQKPEQAKKMVARLMQDHGGRVLSKPRILALDGQTAKVEIGEHEPASPAGEQPKKERFLGLTLEMTPRVAHGRIALEIVATASTATDSRTGEPVAAPIKDWSNIIIATRKLSCNKEVRDGETVTIMQLGDGERNPTIFLTVSPKLVSEVDVPAPNAQPVPKAEPAKDGAAGAEKPKEEGNAKATEARAAAMIIGKFELREATLEEAADTLQALSVEADPQRQGLIINLAPLWPAEARITISMKSVPLHEALKYITSLTNTQLRYEPNRVVISPAPAK